LKFLVTLSWDTSDAKEVTDRFKKWKQVGKYKILYPISTIIGRNEAFTIVECDDVLEAQNDIQHWTDICVYDIAPIEDSRQVVALG
jgi:hypothetical protein